MTPENMTSLVKLNMKNNRFTDLSGAFWANLVNLTELEADNNVINSISNEIGALTTLTLLHLSHNQLSSVPSGFCDYPALLTFPSPGKFGKLDKSVIGTQ